MSKWFWAITADPDNIQPLLDFLDYFEAEYLEAKKDCKTEGSIEMHCGRLPGIVEHRYAQLQEIEAVLKYYRDQHKLKKGEALRKYIEKYNRSLSPTVAEKYADSDPDVVAAEQLVNQVALIRNKFVSITKGLEYKHFQLSNITKLRTAGLDDAEITIKQVDL